MSHERQRPPNLMLQLPRPGAGPAADLPRMSQARWRHAARRCVKVKCSERRDASASARGPGRAAEHQCRWANEVHSAPSGIAAGCRVNVGAEALSRARIVARRP
jgi:hypothetical protein